MKIILHILFITTFVCCSSLGGMENTILTQANALQLPKEIIAYIAGFCWPRQKNILMRVCKDFCTCLKDRTSILKANPSTVSKRDKIREMFKYTHTNNTEMMEFLIKNGISANCSALDITLFHVACDHRHTAAMQLLIKYGANVSKLKPEIHPLHETCYIGDEEMVTMLLKQKVNPNLALKDGRTPLIIAAAEGHSNIVGSLLYFGAQVDLVAVTGDTALTIAAYVGHINIAELLLHAEANIDLASNNQRTPLFRASQNGHTEIVQLLVADKANVNHANDEGETSLMIASANGHTEVVEFLINNQANVNHINEGGNSALHFASGHNHVGIATLLLNADANVNEKNVVGWTPLGYATYNDNIETVILLLNHGADIHSTMIIDSTGDKLIKRGDTPLHIAQKKGRTEIVKLISEHAQKTAEKTDEKETCVVQ